MNGLPEWHEACDGFTAFLSANGLPTTLAWVFRDDIWHTTARTMLVRWPVDPANAGVIRRVFDAGREKGLVAIDAVGLRGGVVLSTVWYPRSPSEEVQGWDRGIKWSIADPLPTARVIRGAVWPIMRLHAGFRRYQAFDGFIRSRAWGAA